MNKYLVSIVTPAYNASNTIRETADSVISQTFSNWEWLIVDDGSSDNTIEIIQSLIEKDRRIKLLKTESNSGAATARNVGIKEAKGNFIAYIDSDDLWEKDKLEKQIKFMIDNDYAFTYSNYIVFSPDGKEKQYRPKKDKSTYKDILKSNVIGCSTIMYNVDKIGKWYMPLDAIKREDQAAWLDMLRDGTVAYRLDESLTRYRVGDKNSVSNNKSKLIKYQFDLYRKHEHFNWFKSFYYTSCVIFNKIFNKYLN